MEKVIAYLPDGTEREFTGDIENTILSLIEKLSCESWPDAMVLQGESEDTGWLHLFHHLDFGWLVVCCGESDTFEHFLVSGDSSEQIEVRKGGLIDKYTRNQFVCFELAEQAITEFIRSGNRLKKLTWEEIGS